jgi:hypothetical protein
LAGTTCRAINESTTAKDLSRLLFTIFPPLTTCPYCQPLRSSLSRNRDSLLWIKKIRWTNHGKPHCPMFLNFLGPARRHLPTRPPTHAADDARTRQRQKPTPHHSTSRACVGQAQERAPQGSNSPDANYTRITLICHAG